MNRYEREIIEVAEIIMFVRTVVIEIYHSVASVFTDYRSDNSRADIPCPRVLSQARE